MTEEERLKDLIAVHKNIAYTARLLQEDLTIKTLLESLPEGVVIINSEGRIVFINNRFSEMTGYSSEEVIGEELSIFIPSELHERHRHHIANYFNNPRIRPMGIGMELTAKRKEGSVFPVEISISHLMLESGNIGLGFVTDITERREAMKELELRNIELDAYAHTVAHDLNSSLMGIVGISDLLLNNKIGSDKDERDKFLNEISHRGRKMYEIIRELLIFSSLGKDDVKKETVDMTKIINSACHRLQYNIDMCEAEIKISDEIINCATYAPWIEEVWYNFISNAIKYGGQPPKINITSIREEPGYIKYSVIDSGEGISDEFKKVIFEQGNEKKDALTKGFGLGLTIVKRIIDKLDGKVEVESEIGKGSTFSFSIKCS